MFCFAIFLVAQGSPVEVDNVAAASKEVIKSENVLVDVIDESIELTSNDVQSSEKMLEEETAENLQNEDEIVIHLIDETSEEVAVPYVVETDESIEGEAFDADDVQVEDLMTDDERERIFGIYIPMCSQYNNDRVALHLR